MRKLNVLVTTIASFFAFQATQNSVLADPATNAASSASASTTAASTASSSSSSSSSNSLGLTIDGDTSDWDNEPMTELHEDGDTNDYANASLLADNKNVYFYIDTAVNGSSSGAQGWGYKITVDGKVYDLSMTNLYSSGGNIGSTHTITMDAWDETDQQDYKLPNAAAYETRKAVGSNGLYTSLIELSIPYGDLGLPSTASQQVSITVKNSNIGTQTLYATGASTGPVISAGVGLSFALVGFTYYEKHRKQAHNA
ncbi:hypothetical protein IV38_GL000690 [Lactobacillus selangorensis]|uniref:Firmicu-CTERM sorting domain-containing protein n=1 Tax=Lactobacillus selangorensis TaxID=81857 RepID=A0A0R2FYA5_9LACO|nr:Firmicu-CTERM sorting domain-containing protein [Lactobacillus selangorensis]KRN27284.1 hypothetical protein IV38_GL000690 [Lactobacillus selangorensis]KRN29933.1 hypothetical protein IV40_GL000531 [Lactobacillus selangorensis]